MARLRRAPERRSRRQREETLKQIESDHRALRSQLSQIGSRQVTAGADINRIADQLTEMLERAHTHARD